MKIIVISLFSFFLIVNSLGQDIMVTFTAEGEATRIDSISALNQTKHEQITIPGDAILHLRSSSGIQSISGLSEQLSVYPNPFSRTCKALITLTEPQRVKLSVHKLTGQVIVQSDQYLQPGTHELDLALGNTGIYLFILQSDSGISTCKLINLSDSGSEARISYLGQGGDWPGSHMMKTHNSKQGSYELNYTEGDRIHFTCYSGSMTTIFTDVPGYSRDYPVEFADCTDPDDKHYRIVKIGEQTWMEENLAYLPEVSPPSEGSDSLPHFYVYGFDGFDVLDAKEQANYQNYGVLYNWRAILQGEASSSHEPSGVQGICPEGWHLPSVGEWRTLLAYLDTDDHIKLKSTYGWCDTCGGDNSSGFKALPGGLFATNEFYQLGNAGRFWSSTEEISWNLWRAGLGLGSKSSHGASVRCLKNTGHPVASFVYTPTVGTDTTLFHFDASSSFSDETPHEELEFRWDWNGDSIWDTSYNSEKIVSHQFQEAGSYKVVLEVKSTDGQVDTQYRYLTIADGIYVDDRDLNRYYYKSIGKQTWMIENLAYLPYLSDQDPGSEKSAQYYVYAYEGKIVSEARRLPNYQKYGVLYNRMAAASACPLGWHLPSGEELYNLNVYLGDKGF
ncbi:MAG: T9SS type A sorting domain-containing protein, partial [Bacteroidetes bacterium]|nr:T9SS type A sorting domain-containing protein [Bacteroidota bacterium]